MQFWLASGLGFALNHIEQSFDRLFGLRGGSEEFCEFDVAALLRSAQKDRIEALARAVQGGIYSPNEARAAEDLDAVAFGDEPRVQAQVIPLSAAGSIPTAPVPDVPPSAPAAKNYQAAVQLDIEALTARARRPERIAALDGAAEPPEPSRVIRKTRMNGASCKRSFMPNASSMLSMSLSWKSKLPCCCEISGRRVTNSPDET